jgi:hypothetical protein
VGSGTRSAKTRDDTFVPAGERREERETAIASLRRRLSYQYSYVEK